MIFNFTTRCRWQLEAHRKLTSLELWWSLTYAHSLFIVPSQLMICYFAYYILYHLATEAYIESNRLFAEDAQYIDALNG